MSTQQRFSQGVAGMRWPWFIAIAAILAAGACSGCERSPHQASGGTSTAAPKRSPRTTIERLLAARQSGSYQPMNELVVPGRVHEIVKTLMAVDEFLQANRILCNYVRDEIALGLSQSIDHASWGAHLDIFSPYVELVDEQIEGKTAMVSFMVDGRLPLQRASLVLVDGQWRYDPGVGYDPQLPAAFQRMARGLRLVLDDLQSGRLSADTIRAAPARLIEEVRVRLLPGVMMLPAPTTQPDDD